MEKRRIKSKELPSELTPEIIAILVDMAREENGETMARLAVAARLSERGELDFILEQANPFKRMKPEDFPLDVLTPDMIESLALMSLENPNSDAFLTILRQKLTTEQRQQMYDRNRKIQREREAQRQASLSPEERKREEELRENTLNNPFRYYGNMGEPETLAQYESRKIAHAKWLAEKQAKENKDSK